MLSAGLESKFITTTMEQELRSSFCTAIRATPGIWTYQIRILAHAYRRIVVAARGHGRSSKPLTGYSISGEGSG